MVSDADELVLYRLNGQRVWIVVPSFGQDTQRTPQSLAWRPDGKVIAVGFNNGDLIYLDVNDGKVINHFYTGAKHPSDEKQTDIIRILVVGSPHSTFGLWIGSFYLDLLPRGSAGRTPVLVDHAASVGLDQHALVIQEDLKYVLQLHDLGLFTSEDTTTTSMINTFNDFQSVSAYLSEALDYLQEEYDLVAEVKRPAFADLEKKLGREKSSSALFAFLMTGVPQPKLKTWLDEFVSERNVKRWEKASQASLNNISRVLDESCMQACNRLVIMIMILRDMSVKETSKATTYLMTRDIDVVLKSAELLIAQLHDMRSVVTAEQELFSAFCEWLNHAVARMPEDDENPDTPMPVETRKVVQYLQAHLWASDFDGFFHIAQDIDLQPFLRLDLSYDTYESFPRLVGQDTPTLAHTFEYLQRSSKQIFAKPAQLMASKWRLMDAFTLSTSPRATARSRFVVIEGVTVLYLAWVEHHESNEPDSLFMLRRDLRVQTQSLGVCKVLLEVADISMYSVQDIQFVDDQELLVLLQDTTTQLRTSHLMTLQYQALQYKLQVIEGDTIACSATTNHVVPSVPTKHKILAPGTHPVALAVNGRKGRRTGLFVQSDRQRYTIFDLDDQEDEIEEEIDEDEAEDEVIMDED
ncbi:Anaphase-promoting complex subunit 4 [Taphrina deformans PYCC 5710]|uniref:Anaphase-promoting complex subunit 4 n=1 Tax=Taphrina deformans (strain PYCC 5710 / ATCC 11124 / CBS 356.35 / IMI 108563 / JCM 9778 / NBRC 8474) TaxID=1097556 RepID=R4X7P8_TAPDE|nr:Anaphase-promoting complex subunit 4 [Taphrina deformans PYCC 5710]|eukprot:CCG81466.1 Anaphase-promoting complex subunit 4 [Taphrina deformans PYCC 5710]